jgi:7-cyano-7-deazaguanine reductase
MLDDLVKSLSPRFMRLKAIFGVRGGIYTTIVAEHKKNGWTPNDIIDLQHLS